MDLPHLPCGLKRNERLGRCPQLFPVCPVLFIEDKMMYNTKDEVPEGYYTVPFGKAAIRHEGKDITVVATMRMGYKAVAVAKEMAEMMPVLYWKT